MNDFVFLLQFIFIYFSKIIQTFYVLIQISDTFSK